MGKKINLTFHPAHPDLAEMFYQWRQDPEMKKYNPMANSSVEQLRERLAKGSSGFEDFQNAERFAWFVKLDSEWVASVNCQNINKTMLNAEIGYNVIAFARGKGIATECVRWITEQLFEHTPLRKLIAFVHEDNIASLKVLEKIGYRREGLLREHYLINGVPANEVMFGLLKSEFLER